MKNSEMIAMLWTVIAHIWVVGAIATDKIVLEVGMLFFAVIAGVAWFRAAYYD